MVSLRLAAQLAPPSPLIDLLMRADVREDQIVVGFTHDLPRFGRISEAEGKLRFDEVDG